MTDTIECNTPAELEAYFDAVERGDDPRKAVAFAREAEAEQRAYYRSIGTPGHSARWHNWSGLT